MNLAFPFIGIIAAWAGLEFTGPPLTFGHLNPLSVVGWILLIGFTVRLLAAMFGLFPNAGRDEDGHD
ncbi:MAG: hypothetical protein AAF986_04200 [Pseudomonadota bacterium]